MLTHNLAEELRKPPDTTVSNRFMYGKDAWEESWKKLSERAIPIVGGLYKVDAPESYTRRRYEFLPPAYSYTPSISDNPQVCVATVVRFGLKAPPEIDEALRERESEGRKRKYDGVFLYVALGMAAIHARDSEGRTSELPLDECTQLDAITEVVGLQPADDKVTSSLHFPLTVSEQSHPSTASTIGIFNGFLDEISRTQLSNDPLVRYAALHGALDFGEQYLNNPNQRISS